MLQVLGFQVWCGRVYLGVRVAWSSGSEEAAGRRALGGWTDKSRGGGGKGVVPGGCLGPGVKAQPVLLPHPPGSSNAVGKGRGIRF